MPHNPPHFDDLPDALTADLGRLYRADVTSSPAVDQAILNRARAHLAGRKRTLLLRRAAGAAAAVILITAAVIPTLRSVNPARPTAARHVNDINADGVVDIRDALALQKSIDAGRATAAGDINGDGVIDKRDVDAIAMQSVRLDRGATR
jgi:hypothetical protein